VRMSDARGISDSKKIARSERGREKVLVGGYDLIGGFSFGKRSTAREHHRCSRLNLGKGSWGNRKGFKERKEKMGEKKNQKKKKKNHKPPKKPPPPKIVPPYSPRRISGEIH